MRLDKYLKVSRIIKRRTVAKEACDGGRVSLNGRQAKAGTEVQAGDQLTIRFGNRLTTPCVRSGNSDARRRKASSFFPGRQKTTCQSSGFRL